MSFSIRTKLFFAFIFIIAAGYLMIVFFLTNSETKVLKQRALEHLKTEAEYAVRYIEDYIEHISSEIQFLKSLEVMDDILVNDLDKRVTYILEKKREELDESVDFIALNGERKVVSFTSGIGPILEKELLLKVTKKSSDETKAFIWNRFLVVSTKVYASFDKKRDIGWLLVILPLENLKKVLRSSSDIISWIIPPKELEDKLTGIFDPPKKSTLENNFIYITVPINDILNGWRLGYAVEKRVAFQTIDEVKKVLLFAFIVMLILVSALTYMVDKHIVEPVRKLAKAAEKIVRLNDYSIRVESFSNDEVGTLSKNFNMLMEKTGEAFETIERRNKEFAQALAGLMELFSKMVLSQTRQETVEEACRELKSLTSAQSVTFVPAKCSPKENEILLECAYGTQNERKYYGTIIIKGAKESVAMEKRFFNAAAKMISLQIEKIGLLETTQEALKSKSTFFSALSHELRTPLGSILSLTQYLMTSNECKEGTVETLGKIESSASHLLQIINDILMMAKAETGALVPSIQSCNLKRVLEESIDMLEPLADTKGILIKKIFPKNNITIYTDPKLLRHLFINIIANAIKYTYDGGIEISINRKDFKVEVIVKDSGIGIEKSALKDIFNEFYREYRVESKETGTGLGLALCKAIADVLDAELNIESEGVGKGTTVKFILKESFKKR